MIELARENPVTTTVAWQEDDIATAQLAGQQIIRGRAERRFDLHPFLPGEAFDVIQPAAADNADPMIRHSLWSFVAVVVASHRGDGESLLRAASR